MRCTRLQRPRRASSAAAQASWAGNSRVQPCRAGRPRHLRPGADDGGVAPGLVLGLRVARGRARGHKELVVHGARALQQLPVRGPGGRVECACALASGTRRRASRRAQGAMRRAPAASRAHADGAPGSSPGSAGQRPDPETGRARPCPCLGNTPQQGVSPLPLALGLGLGLALPLPTLPSAGRMQVGRAWVDQQLRAAVGVEHGELGEADVVADADAQRPASVSTTVPAPPGASVSDSRNVMPPGMSMSNRCTCAARAWALCDASLPQLP